MWFMIINEKIRIIMIKFIFFKKFFFTALMGALCFFTIHSAALTIGSEIATQVRIFLSNGHEKIMNLEPKLYLPPAFTLASNSTYDVYFDPTEGSSIGINKIQWKDQNGRWWETPINLKGSDGFAYAYILVNIW